MSCQHTVILKKRVSSPLLDNTHWVYHFFETNNTDLDHKLAKILLWQQKVSFNYLS